MSEVEFLPWMRMGLAASIGQGASGASTASIQPEIDVFTGGNPVRTVPGPSIQLRGPGDVVSLNFSEIKRRDPADGASGTETNYFCSVEFHAPDLPWRYTPTAVDADGNLKPWLVLIVVESGPGAVLSKVGRTQVLTIDNVLDHLPDLGESWAWAHVQAATSLKQGVATAYQNEPSAFTSRLLCPRRLQEETTYTACIVPAFESGRLTGLGYVSTPSLDPAWESGAAELPVYDAWSFTAGDRFDFKTLARRIKPRELDEDVGSRDLDLSSPGIGLPGIKTPATFFGAMHAPNDGLVYWHNKTDRTVFEAALRKRLTTEPRPRRSRSGYNPLRDDPVVAPSVHGAPQTGRSTVPETSGQRGWFEELNVGPQHRSVAGLGAEVVRADQEALMAAAWEQAQSATGVNRALNRGRLAQESAIRSEHKWQQLDEATQLSIASPALVTMRVDDSTVKKRIVEGDAPIAFFGSAFRRLGRPAGPLSTSIRVPAARAPASAIVGTAAQSAKLGTGSTPSPLSTSYRTRYLPSGMDVGADLFVSDKLPDANPGQLPFPAENTNSRFVGRNGRIERRHQVSSLPTRRLRPSSPDDTNILQTDSKIKTQIDFSGEVAELDLEEFQYDIVRPISAGRITTSTEENVELGIDLAATVKAAVQPAKAILQSVQSRVVVPANTWTAATMPTHIGLQPRFTDPMYERIRALSVDYLVPGVSSVRNNTLGLLEMNPAYVEAFLVGLNHEMSRELRWREYPASLGQTWFQRFWDNVDPSDEDIPPISTWNSKSALGDTFGEGAPPSLVVLIKADLIRKFPDVRVYATPAKWLEGERVPDETQEPVGPSMVGTLQRGVNFYGFEDLTEEEARGDDGSAGWFILLEEEPRAMRFGLDTGRPAHRGKNPRKSWDNLSWFHLAEEEGEVPWFCTIDNFDRIEAEEFDDLKWGEGAAVMAGITFRRPIQVFMHASAMLPEPGGTS